MWILSSVLYLLVLVMLFRTAHSVKDTWENIHLFQVFDSNVDQGHVDDIARYYDFVWGATVKNVKEYSSTSNITLSKYLPFSRDPDDTRTLSYWNQVHPDWVVYQCDKTTPLTLFGDPNLVLDISNPQVIQWQEDAIIKPAKDAGYHMLALDSLAFGNYFGACGVWRDSQTWVQLYSGAADPQYHTDVVTWLHNVSSIVRNYSMGLAILFSRGYDPLGPVDYDLETVLEAADVIVDSMGFTDYGNGFANSSSFAQTLAYMEYVQSRGKAYYSINQYPTINSDVLNWVLASYLVGKQHSAAVFVTVDGMYGSVNWYNEYGAKVGSPVNDTQLLALGVYYRNYTNGAAIVNTGTNIVKISLSTNATTLQGRVWNNYVLVNPQQGVVLLYNPAFEPSPFANIRSDGNVNSGFLLCGLLIVLNLLYHFL